MGGSTKKDSKIAVIGIGGVGGYLAAMLASAYQDVTLVARGKRGEAIRKNGLILHSEYQGEMTVRPGKVVENALELEKQDYIFVCVKNYSLEQVCEEMKEAVSDTTIVIPVMNGADPGDRVRRYLGRGIVADSLIYIVAFANEDYSVTQQGDFANLCVGSMHRNPAEQSAAEKAAVLLAGASVDCVAVDDVEREIWRKYILNCAYNVETAYYDQTIGELRRDPVKCMQYETLVKEACRIALAKGVSVKQEHVDAIIHRFYHELADNATSSLQRDVSTGKPNELETFSGYLLQEAKRLGITLPTTEKMYQELKKR